MGFSGLWHEPRRVVWGHSFLMLHRAEDGLITLRHDYCTNMYLWKVCDVASQK